MDRKLSIMSQSIAKTKEEQAEYRKNEERSIPSYLRPQGKAIR